MIKKYTDLPLKKFAFASLIGLSNLALAAEPPLAPLGAEPGQKLRPAPLDASGFVLPPVPKEAASDVVPDDEKRVLVRDVKFNGNTVIADVVLREIAQPYLGRALGALELEELRRKITLQYVNQGYINSGALLDAKSVQGDGVLQVTLVEGHLSQVRLRGLERLSEHYVVDRLVPDPKAPLNIEDVRERYQLLLSDPLFTGIATRLVPDVELGKAILDVDVTRARPYQLTLFANNYRAPSIGETGLGVAGLVRNLTGYGDALSANWQSGVDGNNSDRQGFNWMLPLNSWGTQLTLQMDEGGSSVIEGAIKSLDIRSKLSSSEIGLNQTVVDTLRSRLTYGVAWSDRTNRTSLLGQPFSFTSGIPNGELKETTWKAWQDFTYRTDSSVYVLRITRNEVQNNLTPPTNDSEARLQPPNQYGYWVTQFNIGHRLTDEGTQLQTRAIFQNAAMHVTSLDSLGIGGVTTVRGYRENQLLRDQGEVITVEVDVPMLRKNGADSLQLNLIPFFDWGQGNNIGEDSSILSSAGLAVRAQARGFTLNLALAQRLIHPDSVDALSGTYQDKSIHFQLSYDVF